MIEYRKGKTLGPNWAWPKNDIVTWKWFNKNIHTLKNGQTYEVLRLPEIISQYVLEKDVVIQAGGNAGVYPKMYSKMFKHVHTFEPSEEWYNALTINCIEENISVYNKCLGDESKNISLSLNKESTGGEKNYGAMYVSGEGKIPMITIDSLNLKPNLIHLDVEGYEGKVLQGALDTIEKYKPIIALEVNNAGIKFNWTQKDVDILMDNLNYKLIKDYNIDKIYGPK